MRTCTHGRGQQASQLPAESNGERPASSWLLGVPMAVLGVPIDALWCGDVAWVHWDATGAAYLR